MKTNKNRPDFKNCPVFYLIFIFFAVEVNKQGYNHVTQETADYVRNELFVEKELMIREDYRLFLNEF
ncbi:hypothetical protein QX233_17845 [Chryseobacterium gambrini]|uniref:Uncharacterized protein n=1 Tax=Chryseobacterium gambrini TaxID=373672 RepID=A0AAJ1R8T5_9FLAO|nr:MULTISPECIES: hypothetical protein [Chryseobacterium]MDN4014337.1 hypothetical protein [Chryseobacterium gambrini]MDN4028211.1 hypothetical protein [Chryseobacterium gambrini]QWA39920.1 hypothetical protein KKI44_06855 [Chryseobacterium sp. ZHDP1]